MAQGARTQNPNEVKKWPPTWPPTQIRKKKQAAASLQPPANQLIKMVGAERFELSTFCTPSKRATRLRYAPMKWWKSALTLAYYNRLCQSERTARQKKKRDDRFYRNNRYKKGGYLIRLTRDPPSPIGLRRIKYTDGGMDSRPE